MTPSDSQIKTQESIENRTKVSVSILDELNMLNK